MAIGYPGFAVAQGYTPDKHQIMLMSPLCQWMRGARAGMDPALIPKGPPMDVSGCSRFHYYCWADLELVRAEQNAYTKPGEAKYRFDKAISMLKGQVQHHNSTPGCSKYLQADVNYTLGKALERYARFTKAKQYYGQAIGPLLKSIELNPDDERPYLVLGDVYAALNKRQQAEEAFYRGLEVNPESKPLLRRYEKIGGKRSLPTKKPQAVGEESVEAEPANSPGAASETVNGQGARAPVTGDNSGTKQANPIVAEPLKDAEATAQKDTTTPTPYCRFCVDEDSGQAKVSPAPSQPGSPNAGTDKPPCRFCP